MHDSMDAVVCMIRSHHTFTPHVHTTRSHTRCAVHTSGLTSELHGENRQNKANIAYLQLFDDYVILALIFGLSSAWRNAHALR
jgi:hypothetical protein